MINYTAQNQLSLALFKHPFEHELDKENRWIKWSALIPWDDLAAIYCRHLQSDAGRLSVNVRTVLAALFVKHLLGLDDRGTVEMIQENIYLQYFCGLKQFTTKKVFDPSLFVDIRKRLGGEAFDAFNTIIINKSEQLKPHQARIQRKKKKDNPEGTTQPGEQASNRGTLKVDATVADQEIKYPTDVNLLNVSRENLERIIDMLYKREVDGTKPRTYRRVARKRFVGFSKKKRKSKKAIRRAIKDQLQYVARDLKTVTQLQNKPGRKGLLTKRDKELLQTIQKVFDQQKWMYDNKSNSCPDRIVNIFQPHVRPIPRGKDKHNTEFGSKVNVSEVNGFTRVDRLSWDAFNESVDVKMQVENFRKIYGCYPAVFLGDSIYLTRENRKFLKEKGITICGKPLGRPPKNPDETAAQKYRKKKKAAQRNHVEAKFGQGKRGYGLNNIMARLPETSESWINAIFFVMNLRKLLQLAQKYPGFFVQFFKLTIFTWIECVRKILTRKKSSQMNIALV